MGRNMFGPIGREWDEDWRGWAEFVGLGIGVELAAVALMIVFFKRPDARARGRQRAALPGKLEPAALSSWPRALSDYGAALRRAGRRMEARAQLEHRLDLAHRLGARRIAALARAELILAGAKPRRDAITGRDALTAGELRVARLAAQGMTNREIAQALLITTKTASAHLTHIYRKLEITLRAELADALASTSAAALPRRVAAPPIS